MNRLEIDAMASAIANRLQLHSSQPSGRYSEIDAIASAVAKRLASRAAPRTSAYVMASVGNRRLRFASRVSARMASGIAARLASAVSKRLGEQLTKRVASGVMRRLNDEQLAQVASKIVGKVASRRTRAVHSGSELPTTDVTLPPKRSAPRARKR